QAGILPYRKARDLGKREMERLYMEIKQVLKEANRFNAQVGRLSHKFIIPHRYGDGVCPKCSKHLESISIGNRTSFFCPKCQR
ncbi:MAG TPA: formamidopyrimidine-DNA glycosylase, partial [Syntrophaceae bacterium]|nr:formamidopyrimidine-DNA glycosylase [Syntrophaceae bacterium]